MIFESKSFPELSNDELYRVMQMRSEVFVVEQNCVYLDQDNYDQVAYHVLGKLDDSIMAYTRIVPLGFIYKNYISIGRVVTSPSIRSKGYGRPLMEFSIQESKRLFSGTPIKISAQSYIVAFYESLGFSVTGKEYLEDDIPHMAMIYEG